MNQLLQDLTGLLTRLSQHMPAGADDTDKMFEQIAGLAPDDMAQRLEEFAQEHPIALVLAAAAGGFVLTQLLLEDQAQ
ncbi:hypothetical protein [Pseudotabrizicola sp. L79]|uniref:hypothetical protein n=1 Tax=Pseudotabrizicola sp. L79 TaxID=3118402 RepID=UPI002F94B9C5